MKLYVNEWKKAQSGKFLLLLFVFGLIVSCLFGVVSKSVADSMDTGDWRNEAEKAVKELEKIRNETADASFRQAIDDTIAAQKYYLEHDINPTQLSRNDFIIATKDLFIILQIILIARAYFYMGKEYIKNTIIPFVMQPKNREQLIGVKIMILFTETMLAWLVAFAVAWIASRIIIAPIAQQMGYFQDGTLILHTFQTILQLFAGNFLAGLLLGMIALVLSIAIRGRIVGLLATIGVLLFANPLGNQLRRIVPVQALHQRGILHIIDTARAGAKTDGMAGLFWILLLAVISWLLFSRQKYR